MNEDFGIDALFEDRFEPNEGDTPMGIEDDCPMDGDTESALASAGFGMDEDYDHNSVW
jgi:hypothetical protein